MKTERGEGEEGKTHSKGVTYYYYSGKRKRAVPSGFDMFGSFGIFFVII